jgi:hypothetical protein
MAVQPRLLMQALVVSLGLALVGRAVLPAGVAGEFAGQGSVSAKI